MRILLTTFLLLSVTGALLAKPEPAEWDAVDRIVVVGDVHGDMDQLLAVLQSADLIDRKNRWVGGETHLVQLGDIPDRGPDTKKIIEYLKRLKRQATKAGGHIHTLIGNHDAMNMLGDLRFVHEGEFKAFRTRDSKERLDILYEETVTQKKKSTPEAEWPEFDRAHKQAWLKDKPLGYVEHRLHWLPDGEFGEWVLSNNAVLKIGDTLFLHGGISPADVERSLDEINNGIRRALATTNIQPDTLVRREDGPLWYRGLAYNNENEEAEHLDRVLNNFGVARIVIGHSPTPGVIVPRFNGRVILADVGLSRHYGDHLACLEIADGKARAIHRGQRVDLPNPDKDAFVEYLDLLIPLENDPSELEAWRDRLKSMPLAR